MSLDDYKLSSALPHDLQKSLNPASESKVLTRKQADLFIARQASLLQHFESKALSPIELQHELKIILKSNPGLSEAYFLSYLNCLRLNEFAGAVDSLYIASNHVVSGNISKLSSDDVNKSFRYADLNLASLHARLGHNEEALAAVKEAIMFSQDAKDHDCLQHALSWLTRVAPDNTIALIQRSITKCEKLSLPFLASLGMLTLCRRIDEVGDRPVYILDLLTRSAVHNCKSNLVDLQADTFLVRANIWGSWGRPTMMVTVTQLLLQLNSAENQKDGVNFLGKLMSVFLKNDNL